MEQPELSDNCQTSPVSAGAGARPPGGSAHAQPAEPDGRWRCRETQEENHREERLEGSDHREEPRPYHREQERLEGSDHREERPENCHSAPEAEYHREDCHRERWALPERRGRSAGTEQRDDAAPRGCNGRASAAAPGGGADEEWRKKKHRRRPSKKKRRWKPYFKLSWEEKRQLEEREAARAARLRADMFAKGLPVAPYNTTQFLMEDRAQAEPDLQAGGAESSGGEEEEAAPPAEPRPGLRPFLLRDFSETYERYHTESLLSMSKQQLLREYLELEKCLSRLEDENNRLRGGGLSPQGGGGPGLNLHGGTGQQDPQGGAGQQAPQGGGAPQGPYQPGGQQNSQGGGPLNLQGGRQQSHGAGGAQQTGGLLDPQGGDTYQPGGQLNHQVGGENHLPGASHQTGQQHNHQHLHPTGHPVQQPLQSGDTQQQPHRPERPSTPRNGDPRRNLHCPEGDPVDQNPSSAEALPQLNSKAHHPLPKGSRTQHPQNDAGDPTQNHHREGTDHLQHIQGDPMHQQPCPGGDNPQHPHNADGSQPPQNASDSRPGTIHQHKDPLQHPCIIRGCDPERETQYRPCSEGDPQQQHPRIRELEMELDSLRAQNTQLLQEKRLASLNNCGE